MTKTKAEREAAILRFFPTPGTVGKDVSPKKSRAQTKPNSFALPRKEGSALPATGATWKEAPVYVPKQVSPPRPGSEDFLQHPSRINEKRTYPQRAKK